MNKKTFFDKKLYIEALRQTKVLGLINLVIALIIGAIIPIGLYLSESEYYQDVISYNPDFADSYSPMCIPVAESHAYYLLVIIFTFIMLISLFSFLNNREQSDFYHSIPHTRRCLFISFSSAVFTWIFSTITIVSVISSILYKLLSKHIILETGEGTIFIFGINIFLMCLLIGSAFLLAQSISGNTLTAIITFFIILLMPRIFLTIYSECIQNAIDFLHSSPDNIFSYKNNLLFLFAAALSDENQLYYILTSFQFSSLYTLMISVILYVLAIFAFTHRKSETAENAMDSPKFQIAFRSIFTMLICCIPICIIFNRYANEADIGDSDLVMLFWIIVCYIGAVVAMILYDFLTTKNIKAALKSLYFLPVIALLNVIFIGILIFSYHYHLNLRINADKVDSVSIIDSEYFNNNSYNYNSYFIQKNEITDKKLIQTLADAFNNYADNYSNHTGEDVTEYDDLNDTMYDYYNTNYNYYYLIKFNGASDYTLEFYITDNLIQKELTDYFKNFLDYNSDLKKDYNKLPKLSEINLDFLNFSLSNVSEDFWDSDITSLYESYRKEVANLDFETWYNICNSPSPDAIGYLNIAIFINNNIIELYLPITEDTPKTYKLAQQYEKKYLKNSIDEFWELIDVSSHFLKANEENNIIIDINTDISNEEPTQLYFDSHVDSVTEVFDYLKNNIKDPSDYNEADDIFIHLYAEKIDTDYYTFSYDMTIIIPKTAFNEFTKIYKNNIILLEY